MLLFCLHMQGTEEAILNSLFAAKDVSSNGKIGMHFIGTSSFTLTCASMHKNVHACMRAHARAHKQCTHTHARTLCVITL